MSNEFLTVTIDVEADCQFPKWIKSIPLSYESVISGIPKVLEPLLLAYGAKPTYLISPEVLEDERSVEVLKGLNLSNCELGTHLHGEYIQPSKKYSRYDGAITGEFSCYYPRELEFAKLENLTGMFKSVFNFLPYSFRSGCFGASASTIASLEKLGYKVDASVTPHTDWENYKHQRLDFRGAPEQPYFISYESIIKPGNSGILEVPVSIRRKNKLLNNFKPTVWLRPSFSNTRQMINAIKYFSKKYAGNKFIIHNIMFHSMEIIPGASPYADTQDDVKKILSRLEAILSFCQKRNIRFATLSGVYDLYKAK